ncbi:MAG: 1-acyl-sn-glycerol-3-phosphate acyltransferase [Pseudomonadales bacterium]|nr:1-acyl-sn-glycerol-3-phosphate acyltransferase [Pseudomonadales bacterium]
MIINTDLLKSLRAVTSVKEFNNLIKTFFSKVGIPIVVSGSIPKATPLLVISNHPGAIDSFLLSSYANREDTYFVGIAKFSVFGPVVKKMLLPIYIKEKIDEKILNFILGFFTKVESNSQYSQEQMKQKNRESISRAAEMVNQDNMVSIFPGGDGGKLISGSEWKAGVGFMVKEISNPKTQVVFVKIHGTKPTDYMIFASETLRKLFYKPQPVQVVIKEPVLLSKIINPAENGQSITRSLEDRYNQIFG